MFHLIFSIFTSERIIALATLVYAIVTVVMYCFLTFSADDVKILKDKGISSIPNPGGRWIPYGPADHNRAS